MTDYEYQKTLMIGVIIGVAFTLLGFYMLKPSQPQNDTFTPKTNQWGRTETLAVTPGTSVTSIIGPFKPHLFNNSSGQVEFDPAAGGQAGDTYLAVRI